MKFRFIYEKIFFKIIISDVWDNNSSPKHLFSLTVYKDPKILETKQQVIDLLTIKSAPLYSCNKNIVLFIYRFFVFVLQFFYYMFKNHLTKK